MSNYDPHPIANTLPLLTGKEFDDLKADIKANGLLMPIVLYDGKILDGRNRFRACQEIGIEPEIVEFTGNNPWRYVWSLNGERRHFENQVQKHGCWEMLEEGALEFERIKAEVRKAADRKRAAAAEQGKVGRAAAKSKKDEFSPATSCGDTKRDYSIETTRKSSTKAAEAAGTNRGAAETFTYIKREAPDLVPSIISGEIKPTEAKRQIKKRQVADKVAGLPKDKFRVIYADPPWKYNDTRGGSISDSYGGAEDHYPSMTLTDLCALGVNDMTQDDAVLFLWVTSPLLPDGLQLAKAWGFTYKSAFIWDKVKHNMGHYNSVRHELLLICTKGSCTPDVPRLFDSVQSIERTDKHSEKPEYFREIIDALYPHGRRIELFRRGTAPEGWEIWGNEAEKVA